MRGWKRVKNNKENKIKKKEKEKQAAVIISSNQAKFYIRTAGDSLHL